MFSSFNRPEIKDGFFVEDDDGANTTENTTSSKDRDDKIRR
jgi:hypothetical protein